MADHEALEPNKQRRPIALSVQLTRVKEKLAEAQMSIDEKDAQIASLKAQLELAERIATKEHTEMAAQDSIHADELDAIRAKLSEIHADVLALKNRNLP